MKINLMSVLVSDQQKALQFYTGSLGFVIKHNVPMGDYSWLTVVSPEGSGDVEMLLEPMAFAPATVYQKALYDAGIPAAAFGVDNVHAEYERLLSLSVTFKTKPTPMGPVIIAVLDDTCGNWIQLVQA